VRDVVRKQMGKTTPKEEALREVESMVEMTFNTELIALGILLLALLALALMSEIIGVVWPSRPIARQHHSGVGWRCLWQSRWDSAGQQRAFFIRFTSCLAELSANYSMP
jgi:hypothetical protein